MTLYADCYLQLEAFRRPDGTVRGFQVSRLTQSLPASPLPGAFLVKLRLAVEEDVLSVPTLLAEISAGDVAGDVLVLPVIARPEKEG